MSASYYHTRTTRDHVAWQESVHFMETLIKTDIMSLALYMYAAWGKTTDVCHVSQLNPHTIFGTFGRID